MSEGVNKSKHYLKHNFLFCSCHGQYIEAGVKDAAITGQTGAEEIRQNELSIIRSYILGETNQLVQILQIHKAGDTKNTLHWERN